MAVLSVQTSTTGQVPNTNGQGIGMTQQLPTVIYISTNDTLATVTTTGYLSKYVSDFQYTFNNYQLADVYTTDSGVVFLRVSVTLSGGANVYSLVAPAESGSITTPTVANQVAYATNTLGTVAAAGLTTALFNAGNITAGLSGTAGTLTSFPSAATSGKLVLAAVTNSGGNFNTTVSNTSSVGQSQVVSIPDGGAATSNFVISNSAGTQTIATGSLALTLGNVTCTAGNLQAGSSGHAGTVKSFSATGSKGSLALVAVANSGDTVTTISNAAMGQASVVSIPDPGASTGQFLVKAAAFVDGNLVKASGTAGLTLDSGVAASAVQLSANIKAGHTADIGGGGAGPITVTLAGITTASTIVANIISSTNATTIQKINPGTGNYTVLFAADPGAACILSYVAFIAAQ